MGAAQQHMETIIKSMESRREGFEEISPQKENYFKSWAREHEPVIAENEIQDYWVANAHRV
jgi:hypothetical protein